MSQITKDPNLVSSGRIGRFGWSITRSELFDDRFLLSAFPLDCPRLQEIHDGDADSAREAAEALARRLAIETAIFYRQEVKMLFVPITGGTLQRGRLTTDHPLSKDGVPVLVDEAWQALPPTAVQCVIPDDEEMAAAAQKAGYAVQTLMSVHLVAGATAPGA